jgi:hypothetical protein
MNKDYVDSLSTQELYEEFQKIVKTRWLHSPDEEKIKILSETEIAIITRILELHLLNAQDPALSEMAEQIKKSRPLSN